MTLEVHSVKLNSSNSDMQHSSLPCGDQQEDKSSSLCSGPTVTSISSSVRSGNSSRAGQYQPDLCPVCQAPSLSSCRTCKKISYCSKGHQRSHWKVHKIDCFPLLEQEDEILGRRLIATRNIKQGEIILREKPIISGPKIVILPDTKKIIIGERESASSSSAAVDEENNKSLLQEVSSPTDPVVVVDEGDLSSDTDPLGNSSTTVCLGCFGRVKTDFTCPSCLWPICRLSCAENVEHKQNECKIFASHQVSPSFTTPHVNKNYNYVYEAITVLRGILLKTRDPSKWNEIVKLNTEVEKEESFGDSEECEVHSSGPSSSCFLTAFTCSSSNPNHKYPVECLEFCKSFLHNICKLTDHTEADIDILLKVMRTSSVLLNNGDRLPTRDLSKGFPSYGGLHLCTRLRMVVQSCVPNSSLVIQKVPQWEICLRATVPIQIGERVTLSLAHDVTSGIMARGRNLSKIKCRTCCPCRRCTDPTEMETFFSAIKCPKKHPNTGYLLPMVKSSRFDTVGENHVSHWKCSECSEKVTSDFYEQTLLPLSDRWSSAIRNKSNSPEIIEKLSEMCLNFVDSTLHPNQYFVYEMEMEVVRRIARNLNSDGWSSSVDERKESLVNQMIHICKKWLEIGEILWKGLTRQRGMILYFLQEGMTRAMIMNISASMRNQSESNCSLTKENEWEKDFSLVLNMRKEVLEIFCLDPRGSVGQAIAQFMVQTRPELLVLRRYFLATQNSNGISL